MCPWFPIPCQDLRFTLTEACSVFFKYEYKITTQSLPGELPPIPPLKQKSCLRWDSTFPCSIITHTSEANSHHCKQVRNCYILKEYLICLSTAQGLQQGHHQLQHQQPPAPPQLPLVSSSLPSVGLALPPAKPQPEQQQAHCQQAINLQEGNKLQPHCH